MAHTPTKRSYEALLSLFSYNTTGRIGAYDFQDLIASTFTGHGFVVHDGTGNYDIDLGDNESHKLVLSGNTTLTFSNPVAGRVYNIIINALSYTIDFPTMLWVDGEEGVPTQEGTDLLTIIYDGTDYLAYMQNCFENPDITITLTYPNGGELLYEGDVCNITWTTTNVDNVQILYSKNNGSTYTEIVSSVVAGLGTYEWEVPSIAISTQCKIKIVDVELPAYYDISDTVFEVRAIEVYNWTRVANTLNSQSAIYSLIEFNSKLYGGTYPGGKLFEWNEINAWVEKADQLNSQTQISALIEFNSKLYGSTYPGGKLFEWNGTDAWVEVADTLEEQMSINGLIVIDNRLYGVTSPNGMLFRWNGTDAWILICDQLNAQMDVFSPLLFNNMIYAGTSPGGRLFA